MLPGCERWAIEASDVLSDTAHAVSFAQAKLSRCAGRGETSRLVPR